MVRFIERFFEKREINCRLKSAHDRIPAKVHRIIDCIHARFSEINFNNGEFRNLNDHQKLSKLIKMINNDSDIIMLFQRRLPAIKIIHSDYIGSFYTADGAGETILFEKNKGLCLYYWNDYAGASKIISVTSNVLQKRDISHDYLRNAIIHYTEKKNFIDMCMRFNEYQE